MFYNNTKRLHITILASLCSLSKKEIVTSNENCNKVHEVSSGKLMYKETIPRKLGFEHYHVILCTCLVSE